MQNKMRNSGLKGHGLKGKTTKSLPQRAGRGASSGSGERGVTRFTQRSGWQSATMPDAAPISSSSPFGSGNQQNIGNKNPDLATPFQGSEVVPRKERNAPHENDARWHRR